MTKYDKKLSEAFLRGMDDGRSLKPNFESIEGFFSPGGGLSRIGLSYLAGLNVSIQEMANDFADMNDYESRENHDCL